MLDKLFMQILDMSITGSVVILVVLLTRFLLKKAPKVISYALWSVVLFRLLCPVSIQAPISAMPEITPVEDTYELTDVPISVGGAGIAAYHAVGDVLNGGIDMQRIPTTNTDEQGNVEYVSADWGDVWVLFGQYVWAAGVAVMIVCSMISYRKLKKRIGAALYLRENIYLADKIPSPFVIGFVRPKIYLPDSLNYREQAYIIAHEQFHIRRGDHIIKALAFFALMLHWFNPLVWVAFVLAGKDMEMSCDEAVIRKFGPEVRADYAASLLTLATGRRIIAGTPLAFGEGDPKGRIRNLAKWKKPVLWITAVAVALCTVLAVCLLTDPVKEDDTLATGGDWYYGTVSDRAMSVVNEGDKTGRPYLVIIGDNGKDMLFLIENNDIVPEDLSVGDYIKILGGVEKRTGLSVALQVEKMEQDEQRYQEQLEEQKREEERLREEAEAAEETRVKDTEPTVPEEYTMPEGIPGIVTYLQNIEDLPVNYTPQQAANDGCVVMIDGDVAANEKVWIHYTMASSRGEAVKVRLVEYWGSGQLKRLYELVCVGFSHIYRLVEDGQVTEKLYKYLLIDGSGNCDGGHYNMFQVYALSNTGRFRVDDPCDDSTWNGEAVMVFCNLYQRHDHAPIPHHLQCAEIRNQNGTVSVIWDHHKLEKLMKLLAPAEGYHDWPKTVIEGATLILTGTDGTKVEAMMMANSTMIEIDGVFYNYDPGWKEIYEVEDLLMIFGLAEMP